MINIIELLISTVLLTSIELAILIMSGLHEDETEGSIMKENILINFEKLLSILDDRCEVSFVSKSQFVAAQHRRVLLTAAMP